MKEILVERFNVRVYGLWVNSSNQVLVTEESLRNRRLIFKFPGGGLELGEGPLQCLHREWREELGLPITNGKHYYTTDFFQQSAFNPREQIISIYYKVESPEDLPILPQAADPDLIRHHWWPLSEFSADKLSLPIDKVVAKMLVNDMQ